MSVISLRLPDDMEQQLVALAKSTGRTKSWLADGAVLIILLVKRGRSRK